MSEVFETTATLLRLQGYLASVDAELSLDDMLNGGYHGLDPQTEVSARFAIDRLRNIRVAVDSATAAVEQLPAKAPSKASWRTWCDLADKFLGDSVSQAETKYVAEEYDYAYRLARNAYTRLLGEAAVWKAELSAAFPVSATGKDRFKNLTAQESIVLVLATDKDHETHGYSLRDWEKLTGKSKSALGATDAWKEIQRARELGKSDHTRSERHVDHKASTYVPIDPIDAFAEDPAFSLDDEI